MDSPLNASVTEYVARFVVSTKASRIPAEVMHLGKRSILDGIGLALASALHLLLARLEKHDDRIRVRAC